MTLIDEAAAGASPKVAKCLAASVTTRTNGVNACTDGIRRGDAEWIYSARSPMRSSRTTRRGCWISSIAIEVGVGGRISIAMATMSVVLGALLIDPPHAPSQGAGLPVFPQALSSTQ